jgi:hypothetical protein
MVNPELIVMRLEDVQRVHPQQDNTRVCDACGEAVGIYPSGQDLIRRIPGLRIVCQHCTDLPPSVLK